MDRSDILLHFFNPDLRLAWGHFKDFRTPQQHYDFLMSNMNIAVLFCKQRCILPPTFILEDEFVFNICKTAKAFFVNDIILLPLRDFSFADTYLKKQREYYQVKDNYKLLFTESGKDVLNFLQDISNAKISRSAKIGEALSTKWLSAPDIDNYWKGLILSKPLIPVATLNKIPLRLVESSKAVTWKAIYNEIKNKSSLIDELIIHKLLQHDYNEIYIKEYKLKIITSLPSETFSILDKDKHDANFNYDYRTIKAVLESFGIWAMIKKILPEPLIALKERSGYFKFISLFETITSGSKNTFSIKKEIAYNLEKKKSLLRMRKYFVDINPDSYKTFDLWDEYFNELENIYTSYNIVGVTQHNKRMRNMINKVKKNILLYVPLKEEMSVLESSFRSLKYNDRKGFYEGDMNNYPVRVLCPDVIGRVAATFNICDYIMKYGKPDYILIIGIGGGFKQKGVGIADIIIPEDIYDLSISKIIETNEGDRIEKIKTDPFPLQSSKLISHIINNNDLRYKWQGIMKSITNYPVNSIHKIAMASVDEVVVRSSFFSITQNVSTTIGGVEMESGGICFVAQKYGLKVGMIRAISDFADPNKGDDAGRKFAMLGLCQLLDLIDIDKITE